MSTDLTVNRCSGPAILLFTLVLDMPFNYLSTPSWGFRVDVLQGWVRFNSVSHNLLFDVVLSFLSQWRFYYVHVLRERAFIVKFVAYCTSFTIKSSIFRPKKYGLYTHASYRRQSFGESSFCLKEWREVAQGNAEFAGLVPFLYMSDVSRF